MNGHQGSFSAGQAWHTESPLQGGTRMECGVRYGLSATQPKNPLTIQSGFIMI